MKREFPEELNRFRLREGPMLTDDDAMYEGCFIIPSPFDRRTTFQVKSSEFPDPLDPTQHWEHVSVIVKKIKMPGNILIQRKPDNRERDYLLAFFWENYETVEEFHNRNANTHLDHRTAQYWRHTDGPHQCPEIYRESLPPEEAAKRLEEKPLSEFSKEWQNNAAREELDKSRDAANRTLYDVRQLIDLAERTPKAKRMRIEFDEATWNKLFSILQLSD